MLALSQSVDDVDKNEPQIHAPPVLIELDPALSHTFPQQKEPEKKNVCDSVIDFKGSAHTT